MSDRDNRSDRPEPVPPPPRNDRERAWVREIRPSCDCTPAEAVEQGGVRCHRCAKAYMRVYSPLRADT